MTFIRIVTITCGFCLIQSLFALADESAVQLPEDGWWIRYFITSKREAINGKAREYTIRATYSLVGTVAEDRDNQDLCIRILQPGRTWLSLQSGDKVQIRDARNLWTSLKVEAIKLSWSGRTITMDGSSNPRRLGLSKVS